MIDLQATVNPPPPPFPKVCLLDAGFCQSMLPTFCQKHDTCLVKAFLDRKDCIEGRAGRVLILCRSSGFSSGFRVHRVQDLEGLHATRNNRVLHLRGWF